MVVNTELYHESLAEFTQKLVARYDVDAVLTDLAARLALTLGAEGAGVLLGRNEHLEFSTGLPDHIAALERVEVQMQSGPCVTAFQEGAVVPVRTPAAMRRRWPRYAEVAAEVGVGAVLAVPMSLEGRCFGVVDVCNSAARDWDRDDTRAATVMANMATVFLVNSRLYDEQRLLAEQLRHALDSRVVIEQAKGMIAAEHGISVRDAFERLRHHARAHNASVREVAHAVVELGLRPAAARPPEDDARP